MVKILLGRSINLLTDQIVTCPKFRTVQTFKEKNDFNKKFQAVYRSLKNGRFTACLVFQIINLFKGSLEF